LGEETATFTAIAALNAADLVDMTDAELGMALIEWKRWRNRVWQSVSMRRREERFAEAQAAIRVIEAEMRARTPAERERQYWAARDALKVITRATAVSLEAYRSTRRELARLSRRSRG
jgi:hypothetical protein